jgi:diketogulonate reductase-like aldo/keto reductase
MGRAVQEIGIRRDDIFITTKVWNSHQGYDSTLHTCEGSLRRLGLSYVDLYLIHWPVQGLITANLREANLEEADIERANLRHSLFLSFSL